jgi:hypothetical protein
MAWQQNVTPNLDPYVYVNGQLLYDWYGWCLATVRCAYNAPYSGMNAWSGWMSYTQVKHEDRNFPVGVYFPIWYSGYGGLGHVAIAYVNQQGAMNIWTSPYKHVPYFYTGYHDVDALARGYGLSFAGWSEDIGGMRVIQYVDDTPPPPPPAAPPVYNEPTPAPVEQPTPVVIPEPPVVVPEPPVVEPPVEEPPVLPTPVEPPTELPPEILPTPTPLPPAPKPTADRFWLFNLFVRLLSVFTKGHKK